MVDPLTRLSPLDREARRAESRIVPSHHQEGTNMRISRTLALLLLFAPAWPAALTAQVPADLRTAIEARARSVAQVDAATWDRLTADDFTVVNVAGKLMTKAVRLAEL